MSHDDEYRPLAFSKQHLTSHKHALTVYSNKRTGKMRDQESPDRETDFFLSDGVSALHGVAIGHGVTFDRRVGAD